MKLVASTLALFAAVSAFATTPAAAATAPAQFAVQADLNGDGTLDRVVVRTTPDNPNQQSLVATVGRTNYVAHVPLPDSGLEAPRVVDLDGNGRDEVVVKEYSGANTDELSVWGFNDGFGPFVMSVPWQAPLRLWEGGGASAINRFGCEVYDNEGRRKLVTVQAERVSVEHEIYAGERVTYFIHNGYVTVSTRTQVTGTPNHAAFQADPASCM